MSKTIRDVSIGRLIKEARKRKGLTQKDLSSLIGCSLAHLARIETEAAYPSIQLLGDLQTVLDTLLFDLFPFFDDSRKQALFSSLLHHIPLLRTDQLKTLSDLSALMVKGS